MADTQQAQRQYLFTITHFENDSDRVATPLVLANNALAAGGDVLVWLSLDGVKLAKKNAANSLLVPKSFPPVAELLKVFSEAGGRIGVCPPCAKTHGVVQEDMLPNAEFMGGAAVVGAADGRQVFSF